MNVESEIIDEETAMKNLKLEDKWIISRVNYVTKEITSNLDNFDLGIAVHKIYEFIWNEYCDWYIELVKPRLYGDPGVDKDTAIFVLVKVMKDMLKLLHPVMPFITEEIWGYLPGNSERLISAAWPEYSKDNDYKDAEEQMNLAMNIVRSIRNIKAEMDVLPSKKVNAYFIPGNNEIKGMIEDGQGYFSNLAKVEEIKIINSKEEAGDNAASSVIDGVEIYIPLADLIDFEKEVERLEKEKSKLEGEIKRASGKLNNKKFTDKAPEKVVAAEKEKLEKYKDMYNKVIERIEQLKK